MILCVRFQETKIAVMLCPSINKMSPHSHNQFLSLFFVNVLHYIFKNICVIDCWRITAYLFDSLNTGMCNTSLSEVIPITPDHWLELLGLVSQKHLKGCSCGPCLSRITSLLWF